VTLKGIIVFFVSMLQLVLYVIVFSLIKLVSFL